ncbi:hypothetical protein OLMES_4210 [Oleiphilus messinensis]|uniref:DUF2491 family protein n=1 Tax=Oleiphilus messinensis TaxID=141451 RepID=A0A1Y0IEJ7_9GAMM|nr:YjfK family protein [Oleiphilus messinensis]ARU58226.1 hypothetical protein OLMES_4210 [Oleiphilus messinensis]
MFSRWTKKETKSGSTVPEIIGLRLNGVVELDDVMLKLVEPSVVFEGAARTQMIQAVGEVKLDQNSKLLRFYTDDDGFIQVLLNGGTTEANIEDVKLWYFYETRTVGSDADWDNVLKHVVSQETWELEGNVYHRVWGGAGAESPPVAMTERTYTSEQSSAETDQFVMLYERQVDEYLTEFVLVSAEEKIVDYRPDRFLVISTGINLKSADLSFVA